jgi:ankyrin repeat protein
VEAFAHSSGKFFENNIPNQTLSHQLAERKFYRQACENKAPSEVIKSLITAYPESLMMKDSFGDLPLHLACRERGSKAAIAVLLSKEPAAAQIEDAEGRLPLHLACRQGVAVQIVDSLIVCYYRAARTPDSYSLIPLHWACAQNSSLAIIESLLRAHPDPCDLKDKWGRTPLSLAEASTNPEKEKVIKALLKEPTFWTTSLVDEIDTLKHKLDETAVEKDKFTSQVNELQGENAKLRDFIYSQVIN